MHFFIESINPMKKSANLDQFVEQEIDSFFTFVKTTETTKRFLIVEVAAGEVKCGRLEERCIIYILLFL